MVATFLDHSNGELKQQRQRRQQERQEKKTVGLYSQLPLLRTLRGP